MRRPTPRFILLAALLLVPAFAGCGGGGSGEVDSGPMFEPLDAGNDTCVNSTVTCSASATLDYQFCTTEDMASCYVRRSGSRYDCAVCTGVVDCLLATEDLVAEQCPAP